MRQILGMLVLSCGFLIGSPMALRAADTYAIDNQHTSVNFKITHVGISWVHGRFNDVKGRIVLDSDPEKSSITLTIPVSSIDTKVRQRDEHLLSPDFFDAAKFPEIVFKSTKIQPTSDGLEVIGTVSLHGKPQPLTFKLTGGKTAEFPPGVHRVGYTTSFVLKRSDFDMKTMLGPIGDDVYADVSFEAIRQ